MSSSIRLRRFLKDLVVAKLLNNWTRSYIVSAVVRQCRNERNNRVIRCFKYAFLKPSRTVLLSATTAAYKNNDKEGPPKPCEIQITDDELQALVTDFETLDELSQQTLYCAGCERRVRFDKSTVEVKYCACKNTKPNAASHNGWVPYMEAEDCVIWRKEYKGAGHYAYKVYGRYKDIKAQDFAAVQIDGAYRSHWDDQVAKLMVVESNTNGVENQFVIHWEVLWPRLFSNRDYVYLRRHKTFSVKTRCLTHTDGIFNQDHPCERPAQVDERPNVHAHAKRKSQQKDIQEKLKQPPAPGKVIGNKVTDNKVTDNKVTDNKVTDNKVTDNKVTDNKVTDNKVTDNKVTDNKVYVIVSRSCEHPRVPETSSVVRVKEYWSHMVIRTVDGADKPGTEFVLTYYDEPAVGGMPSSLASFAAARGAPAFLAKMRGATQKYRAWAKQQGREPVDIEAKTLLVSGPASAATLTERENKLVTVAPTSAPGLRRDAGTQTLPGDFPDKDSCRGVPIMVLLVENSRTEEITQENTENHEPCEVKPEDSPKVHEDVKKPEAKQAPDGFTQTTEEKDRRAEGDGLEGNGDRVIEEEDKSKGWYRQLYPLYYFIRS